MHGGVYVYVCFLTDQIFQKFLRFPYGQSTQPSIGFKTSAQGFKILSKAIQTID